MNITAADIGFYAEPSISRPTGVNRAYRIREAAPEGYISVGRVKLSSQTQKNWERCGLLHPLRINERTYLKETELQAIRTPQHCSCGRMYLVSKRAMHERSVYHRQADRIRALLHEPCINFQEIGRRIGVSRERVRQIARDLEEQTGHVRQKICTVRRYPDRQREQREVQIERLRQRLGSQICTELDRRNYRMDGSAWPFTINHLQCALATYKQPARATGRGHVRYNCFKRPAGDWQYVILKMPQKVYIVPIDWLPAGPTFYVPVGRIEGYKNIKQRDWEQWRDRYDLLVDTAPVCN